MWNFIQIALHLLSNLEIRFESQFVPIELVELLDNLRVRLMDIFAGWSLSNQPFQQLLVHLKDILCNAIGDFFLSIRVRSPPVTEFCNHVFNKVLNFVLWSCIVFVDQFLDSPSNWVCNVIVEEFWIISELCNSSGDHVKSFVAVPILDLF